MQSAETLQKPQWENVHGAIVDFAVSRNPHKLGRVQVAVVLQSVHRWCATPAHLPPVRVRMGLAIYLLTVATLLLFERSFARYRSYKVGPSKPGPWSEICQSDQNSTFRQMRLMVAVMAVFRLHDSEMLGRGESIVYTKFSKLMPTID